MSYLDGKVALVVGGSRGIGQVIVPALAAEGAAVWALGRDAGRLDQLKRELGRTAAAAYAAHQGISEQAFLGSPTLLRDTECRAPRPAADA